MTRTIWKKPEREALVKRWDVIVRAYGATVRESYRSKADDANPVQYVGLSPDRACSRTFELQTTAGTAETNCDFGPVFGHIYICFYDPKHAWSVIMGPDAGPPRYGGDLNGFSGKWNLWTAPDAYWRDGKPSALVSGDMLIQQFIGRLCRVAPRPYHDMLARIAAADITAPKYETEAA